jgi:hypothetical protein
MPNYYLIYINTKYINIINIDHSHKTRKKELLLILIKIPSRFLQF